MKQTDPGATKSIELNFSALFTRVSKFKKKVGPHTEKTLYLFTLTIVKCRVGLEMVPYELRT